MSASRDEADAARDHFVAWVQWYLETYADETPSYTALAERLEVSKSAVSQILAKGSRRRPRFEVLIAFHRTLGRVMRVPMDALLYSDPPRRR